MSKRAWTDAALSGLALWREFATAVGPTATRLGVSPEQIATLAAIKCVEEPKSGDHRVSAAAFAEVAGLADRRSRQAAYGCLDRRRRKGPPLVKSERDPKDRRNRILSLTAAGQAVLDEVDAAVKAFEDEKIKRFRLQAETLGEMVKQAEED